MYAGPFLLFKDSFNMITGEMRILDGPLKGEPTDKLRLHTIMFHSFILMTLFN